MTTNMSYLLNDGTMMKDLALAGFNRRRQLVPFPLEPDDIIDVTHPPSLARLVRRLRDEQPKTLHWNSAAVLQMKMPENPTIVLDIQLHSRESLPLPVEAHAHPSVYVEHKAPEVLCVEGATTARLREWAWKAMQIELETRWSMRIVTRLLTGTTTHQQVHRYMPEFYQLIANQQEETVPSTHWGGRRIVEVHAALKELGSSRAKRIDLLGVTTRDRANLKAIVAQCLLLNHHGGLKRGSNFDATWVDWHSVPVAQG